MTQLSQPIAGIWAAPPSLALMSELSASTLIGHLGIEFLEVGDDHLTARMPVDGRTLQPFGVLHGGASVVLAETLASWAAALVVDPDKTRCVGMEINANHLRPVSSGWVTGVVRPVALGRRSQVWEVRISNEDGKPVCVSRCTMAVVEASAFVRRAG